MKTIILFILGIIFTSCNFIDLDGMFIVNESVNSRFEQSLAYNKTKSITELNVSKDDYNIFVMGDVHIGETRNFDISIDQIKNSYPTALVLDGDICNGNDYEYEIYQNHLPDIADLQYFTLAGNHELYFGGWKEYYKRFGSSSYYFVVKTPTESDLFICLDTGSGTLGSKQLAWFKNILIEKRQQYRRCIVFTHNNLYRIRHTLSTNPVNEELLVLTELFAKHNIDMVVTGHDHVKNVVKLGNTTHITMNALLDGYTNAGYFKINIKNGQIGYEFIQL